MRQQAPTLRQVALAGAALVLIATTTALQGVACKKLLMTGDDEGYKQQGLDDTTRRDGRSLLQTLVGRTVKTTGYNGATVWYVVYKAAAPVDWRTAYRACSRTPGPNKRGYMVLASITSATASAAVHTAARAIGLAPNGDDWSAGYWIGLNDISTEGTFSYVYSTGGAPATAFTAWMPGEPNDPAYGGEDCVGVITAPNTVNPGWNDYACLSKVAGYVCEEIPGVPLPPMPGVNPMQGSNLAMYSGIPAGTSPSWEAARANCEASGTWLVKINSTTENTFVRTNYFPGTIKWLGGTDAGQEGTWRWISDDSVFTYSNWNTGEPNNQDGVENYLMMWSNAAGTWNDHGGSADFAYVCWLPPSLV